MSTEEKVVNNDTDLQNKEVDKATENSSNSGTDSKGNEVPVKEQPKEAKQDNVNEQILEFLKRQTDTIEKQSKIIEELTKANEEIHKKVSQVETRVDKNTPTVVGSYNFDVEMQDMNDKELEISEALARDTLDMISRQFNIN